MLVGKIRSRLREFVLELRRRKVFRVVVAYVVVGAGIAEGATIFLPALGAPSWVPNMVAVIVVLGFPVAMVLAWAFDVIPDPGSEDQTADGGQQTEKVGCQRAAGTFLPLRWRANSSFITTFSSVLASAEWGWFTKPVILVWIASSHSRSCPITCLLMKTRKSDS